MKKAKGKTPRFFENHKFEQFLGIESTEIVYNNRYNDDYFRYEPTSYSGLICAFDELEGVMSKYDRLVDFGCGKGRVLFYVNQRFQCEVCGIEVDEELYENALDNRAYFNTRFRGSSEKIEILNQKAEEYAVHPEDTVFYFFNPFEINIFEQVVEHIIESVQEHPRRIFLLMYYPKEEYRTHMKRKRFKLYRIAKLPSYAMDWDEKVVIYEYGQPPEPEEFDIYR
ncbi:MAG: class I SAM-dependent methyltransferase [Bacteroidales bacterium]|nr:class I SAM-dependent methyltransferase [Clostridium sp.]MCM1204976.1 class I SAM-dependent methyltransferase [Bacteroidales bacterium]